MEYFRTIEEMQVRRRIREFEDLRGKTVSGDLRKNSVERLFTTTFDTKTTWPERDKLPPDFSPEKTLEDGKDPGLGIRELHEQGITGKGVRVAIIDQRLLTDHEEYKDKLVSYTEYGSSSKEPPSMHGPGVASLLVGEHCGVAPGAELVYAATPSGKPFLEYTKALNDIIEHNRKCEPDKKIRAVSCSIGAMKNLGPAFEEWMDTIIKAKKEGIMVVDIHTEFGGGGAHTDKDNPDSYDNPLFLKNRASYGDEYKEIIDNYGKRSITVPADYRTVAGRKGVSEYEYSGEGGISWTIPYVVGIFALALQVNPDLRQEEIIGMIYESATVNKKGLKIINPKGIIELARGRVGQ
ncbi:hypothetical protein HYW94_02740 [Candidatus Uhrbacteria bacterium]|nr:hypothetical protein [Candidatus Uhrbacteria bacterium]